MQQAAKLTLTDRAAAYMGSLGFMQGTFADTRMPYFAKKPGTDPTGHAWVLVDKPLSRIDNPSEDQFSYVGLKARMEQYINDPGSPMRSFSMAFLKDGQNYHRRMGDFKELQDRGQYADLERKDLFDITVFLSQAEELMRLDLATEDLPTGKIIYFDPSSHLNSLTSEVFEHIPQTGRYKQFYTINQSESELFFSNTPMPIDPHSTEYALVANTE